MSHTPFPVCPPALLVVQEPPGPGLSGLTPGQADAARHLPRHRA